MGIRRGDLRLIDPFILQAVEYEVPEPGLKVVPVNCDIGC